MRHVDEEQLENYSKYSSSIGWSQSRLLHDTEDVCILVDAPVFTNDDQMSQTMGRTVNRKISQLENLCQIMEQILLSI